MPDPNSVPTSWARLLYGWDLVARSGELKFKTGLTFRHDPLRLTQGIDGIVYGNIPGGGLSRSAALLVNFSLSLLSANGRDDIHANNPFEIVEMAQAAEHSYGSPCGQLDQIMILFAKERSGTYYNPKTKAIRYIPFGGDPDSFRLVVLDTGTERPGLEKSTYAKRKTECEELAKLLYWRFHITSLADVKGEPIYRMIMGDPDIGTNLKKRLTYVYHAQQRFYRMLEAWREGDIKTVGAIFRQDGYGLRDDYQISGQELEAMCTIARAVQGVYGERMLGGGDKGASGAIVRPDAVHALRKAVDKEYPQMCPGYKHAVHPCKFVEGVAVFDGLLN